MAFPIGAIPLTGAIGLTDVSDVFATHLSTLGQGGHREVATVAERDMISVQRRSFGMTVTVNADPTPANNKTYQLSNSALGGVDNNLADNANWTTYNPAGAAPISFQNGLSESGGIAKLGGTLIESTLIVGASQLLTFGHTSNLSEFNVNASIIRLTRVAGSSLVIGPSSTSLTVDSSIILSKSSTSNTLIISAGIPTVSTVVGGDILMTAGQGYSVGDNNGGNIRIRAGLKSNSGVNGNYIFGWTGAIDALGGAVTNAGGVLFIEGASKNPVANPANGGIFYSNAADAYKPYWRTPAGVTYDLTAGTGGGGGQALIQFKDEGINLGTIGTVNTVNFVGAGVTATRTTDTITVTIPSGVSNSKSQYFNGDGVTTQFNLVEAETVQIFFVDVGGQVVENVADFTIDNVLKRVTFGTAPVTGQRIGIYYFTQLNIIAGSGGGTWGSIVGTLSDQTDLNDALNLKVPTTRTLTINGTALDLSANRSWSVGDLLSSGSYANPTWITSLDAGKITTGTLPLSVIPAAALERVYVYTGGATLPENAGLTTSNVQNGDVVKMNTTGIMYVVTNDAALNNAASYVAYNAGTAASVPWSGITSKPTTLAGFGITDAWFAASGVAITANNTISGAFNIGFTNNRVGIGVAPASITTNTKFEILGDNTNGTNQTVIRSGVNFAQTSGTATARGLLIIPTYNTTSTYSGIAYGIDYDPLLTSVIGLTNIAFRATSGSVLIGGTTLAAGTRLDVRGLGTTSSTYALKVENSFGDDLFFIRDDGRISLGRDVDTNYREIIKSVGNASTTYGFGVFNSSDLLLGRFRDDQVFELGGDAAFITVTPGVAAGDAAIQFLPYTTGSGLAYRFQDTNLVDFMRFFNQTTTMRREVVMAQPVTYSYGSGEERQTKQYQIDSDGVANSENVVFEFTLADAEHYDIKVLHADAVADDGTSITTTAIDYADVYKEASVNIQGNTGITTLSRIKTSDGVFNWNLDTTNQKIQYRFKSNTTGTKVFRIFVDITLVKRITPVFE